MAADDWDSAGSFSVGGCLIIVSFSLAMVAALCLREGVLYSFIVFLVVAGLVGLVGFYNAFRALQEVIKKSEASQIPNFLVKWTLSKRCLRGHDVIHLMPFLPPTCRILQHVPPEEDTKHFSRMFRTK